MWSLDSHDYASTAPQQDSMVNFGRNNMSYVSVAISGQLKKSSGHVDICYSCAKVAGALRSGESDTAKCLLAKPVNRVACITFNNSSPSLSNCNVTEGLLKYVLMHESFNFFSVTTPERHITSRRLCHTNPRHPSWSSGLEIVFSSSLSLSTRLRDASKLGFGVLDIALGTQRGSCSQPLGKYF